MIRNNILNLILLIMMSGSILSAKAHGNILTIPDVTVKGGGSLQLPVCLDNVEDIVGVEFDLSLPDGLTVEGEAIPSKFRTSEHMMEFRMVSGGVYKGVIYSAVNAPLSGRTGEIMTIPIKASSSMKDGSVHQFILTNVILADSKGDNVASGFKAGALTVAKSPDVTVRDVRVSSSSVDPSQDLSLSWTVSNIGGLSTEAGFSEHLFLVDGLGNEKLIGTAESGALLAPDESVARFATVKLPPILGLDGRCSVKVMVVPNPGNGEPSWLQSDNTAMSSESVEVGRRLSLASEALTVSEGEDSSVSVSLLRSGSMMDDEVFDVTCSEADSRFTIPDRIVIPKGSQGAKLVISVVPNGIADDMEEMEIVMGNERYGSVSLRVKVEDDFIPTIGLEVDRDEVEEGEALRITMTTDRVTKEDLEISLICDNPGRLRLPTSVTIPAGASSLSFNAEAVDNVIPDGDADIEVFAKVPGYDFKPLIISVLDDDMPEISLLLSSEGVAENDGRHAVTGVITRSTKTDSKIVVRLTDDSPGQLEYSSSTIVMQNGVESVEFTFGPVDNALSEGDRRIMVTAGVYMAGCLCTPPMTSRAGVASSHIIVTDDDGPMLTLSGPSSVAEGGKGEFILRRNTGTDAFLDVRLLASEAGSVKMPVVVTIPEGLESVAFTVEGLPNSEMNNDRRVFLTAQADGFGKAFASLNLTDRSVPDARILRVEELGGGVPTVASGSSVDIRITLANHGTADLPELTPLTVYIDGKEKPLAPIWTQEPLPVGNVVDLTASFTVPDITGPTFFRILANESRSIQELDYTNNIHSIPVSVVSPYSAKVTTDKSVYGNDERIDIKGMLTGNYIAGDSICVYVDNAVSTHRLMAEIQKDGSFKTVFEPYKGLIGSFRIGACHPTSKKTGFTDSETTIDVLGLRNSCEGRYVTHDLKLGEVADGMLRVSNPCSVDISDIMIEVEAVEGIDFVLGEYSDIVQAGKSIDIPYSVKFNRVTTGLDWEKLDLRLYGGDVSLLDIPLYLFSRPEEAVLRTDLTLLETSVVKGTMRKFPIVIANHGGSEAKDISFSLPSWMSVAPTSVPKIQPGKTAEVILSLKPGWNPGESNHNGKIFINCPSAASVAIPYDVEVVAAANGILEVEVCDNNTYLQADAPKVAGASVTLRNASTGKIAFTGISDESGFWREEIPEGVYSLQVSAEGHDSNNWYVTVDPGRFNRKVANITVSSGVTYSFDADEVELEDSYSLVVTGKYESNVPRPDIVITALDQMLDQDIEPGEGRIIRFLIKNVGLIRAEEVEFQLPPSGSDWSFELLYELPVSSLEAGRSMVVPVLITRGGNEEYPSSGRKVSSVMERCMENFIEHYKFYCGTDMIDNHAAYRFAMKTCAQAQLYSTLAGSTTGGSTGGSYSGPSRGNDEDDGFSRLLPPLNPPVGRDEEYYDYDEFMLSQRNRSYCNPEMASRAEAIVGTAMGWVYPIVGILDDTMNATIDWQQWHNGHEGYKKDFFGDLGSLAIGFGGQIAEAVFGEIGGYVASLCNILLKMALISTDSHHLVATDPKYHTDGNVPSWVNQFEEETRFMVGELEVLDALMKEYFGDDVWIRPYNEEGDRFFRLFSDKSLYNEDGFIPFDVLSDSKPSYVSDVQLRRFIDRLENTCNGSASDNLIDMEKLQEYTMDLMRFEDASVKKGFKDSFERYNEANAWYRDMLEMESNSVCASVTLQFNQSLAMTRQAFRGTLTVYNGHKSEPIRDFRFIPTATDADGNVAGDLQFAVTAESLSGFEGEPLLGSVWTLKPEDEGSLKVLYVPTQNAAPEEDTVWGFGGNISYVDPFTETPLSINLSPVFLTVRPTPVLNLDYFLQRDVFGDDPFTDVVEPSVPAEFALLLTNVGKGTAENIRITTAQPEVAANAKGLDVDFRFESSALDGQECALAVGSDLKSDVGDVPPGEGKVIQWWFTSSLLGHFIDYDVECTHVSNYDNPGLSLIKDVKVHELVHSVRTSDDKIAFLVNDIPDGDDFPESICFADGAVSDVLGCQAALEYVSDKECILHVESESGKWIYGVIRDPAYGLRSIEEVVRIEDGKELPVDNFWQTDRTLIDGHDPLYENMIHFADCSDIRSRSYLIRFSDRMEGDIQVDRISGIPENGVSENSVETVAIHFNKPIDSESFSISNIELYRDSEEVSCDGCSIIQVTPSVYSLDVSKVVYNPGDYRLVVNTFNVRGLEGGKGKHGKCVSWTELGVGDCSVEVIVSPEGAGTISPLNVAGKFGEKVTLSATPSTGFRFWRWEENGSVLSVEDSLSINIYAGRKIMACFVPIDFNVTVESGDGGKVSCVKSLVGYGSVFTVTATPDEDFEFDGWVVNERIFEAKDRVLTLTITEDTHIYAEFRKVWSSHKVMLGAGWNWISSYLQEADLTGLIGEVIVADGSCSDGKLAIGSMAKVNSPFAQLWEARGRMPASGLVLTVGHGTDWIGLPSQSAMNLADAFESGPLEGDFIYGQRGFSEYCGGSWIGTLDTLISGEGYMYYVAEGERKLIFAENNTYPSDSDLCRTPSSSFSDAMPLTLVIDGINEDQERYIVEAKCGDQIRGTDCVVDGRHMLTLFGNIDDEIVLYVKDKSCLEDIVAVKHVKLDDRPLGSRKIPLVVNTDPLSVESIMDANCEVSVCLIDGTVILDKANPKLLMHLSPGIYIVNGRRVYIK